MAHIPAINMITTMTSFTKSLRLFGDFTDQPFQRLGR